MIQFNLLVWIPGFIQYQPAYDCAMQMIRFNFQQPEKTPNIPNPPGRPHKPEILPGEPIPERQLNPPPEITPQPREPEIRPVQPGQPDIYPQKSPEIPSPEEGI